MFHIASTTVCHLPLSWATSIRSKLSHRSSVPSILILLPATQTTQAVSSLQVFHETSNVCSWTAWPFKMEPTSCPETSITTNLCCVTSQKGENFTCLLVLSKLYHSSTFNFLTLRHVSGTCFLMCSSIPSFTPTHNSRYNLHESNRHIMDP